MRSRRLALSAGAALAAVVLAAGPALAGADGPVIYDPTGGAAAWFVADGDAAYVQDIRSDGHSAVVRVYVPDVGIAENLWNPDGVGTVRSKSYGTAIPEGTTVYYQACTGEFGTRTLVDCSPGWTHGTA